MNSSQGAHALHSQFDSVDEDTPSRHELTIVKDPPRPFEDPLFRYVFLGFMSFFFILGVAAILSF